MSLSLDYFTTDDQPDPVPRHTRKSLLPYEEDLSELRKKPNLKQIRKQRIAEDRSVEDVYPDTEFDAISANRNIRI